MILLDVPNSVERERAVNAVRSSLDPSTRYQQDRAGYKQEHQRALLADANQKAAASVANDAGRPTTVFEAQRGLLLQSSVVIERLKALNSHLVFQRSVARPDWVGVYIPNSSPDYLPEGLEFTGATFSFGNCPEFSVKAKTEDRVEENGTVHAGECIDIPFPGWRQALQILIRKRLISEQSAELLFGLPSNESMYWATLTGKRSA